MKQRRLLEEVKAEHHRGRRVQIFAVYTQKRDVTQRLKNILSREGIRVEVLTTAVPPEAREAWCERQLKAGLQVCIAQSKARCHGIRPSGHADHSVLRIRLFHLRAHGDGARVSDAERCGRKIRCALETDPAATHQLARDIAHSRDGARERPLGEVDLAERGPLHPLEPELAPTGLVQLALPRQRVAARPRSDNDAQPSLGF